VPGAQPNEACAHGSSDTELSLQNTQMALDIRDERGKRIDIARVEHKEQELARQYIKPDDVVLELGARYGSVSCTINKKLANQTHQVSVEPDSRVWDALDKNRLRNKCSFHTVKGFISNRPLGLTSMDRGRGYGTTAVSDPKSDIPHHTLAEIAEETQLTFNVLVADCEGYLGEFLQDNPELYKTLRLVIFEADHSYKCDYQEIRMALRQHNFNEKLFGHQNVWIRKT
jgi:FkbM family methyltransferase